MVTTTTDPGTISVPMSSILDALEGVLTEDERHALFEQLIGITPAGVAPGDLITAELFNSMLGNINDLQMRVAVLEGASDNVPHLPVITQIVPQLVKTGQEFTVFGKNLNANLLSRIDVDQTNIPLDRIKEGSSPTQLVLEAPAVIGLPDAGATVILAVSNPAGTAQGSYVQLPGVATNIQATIAFLLKSVNIVELIKPGKAYELTFELTIQSSHDETFVLTPQMSGVGWSAVNKAAASIPVTKDSALNPVKVTKVVTVTTGGSGSGSLVLNVTGTNFPTYNASSQPVAASIGGSFPIPTDKIQVKTVQPIGSNAKFSNNTLWIKQTPDGGPGTITLSIQYDFTMIDTFQIGAPAASPASDWTALRTSSASIQVASNPGSGLVTLKVTPKSNGNQYIAADGQLDFTVQASNGTASLPFTAQLRVVSTLPL